MGTIEQPQPVKLFVGIICSGTELLWSVEKELTLQFGAVETRSETYAFNMTDYYQKQMGAPLWRQFLSFTSMIDAGDLGAIKIQTNALEAELASRYQGVDRPVNLDPGYMELAKIVLASTKNFYHRIWIAEGIYGEVTMHFEGGRWKHFPWTFPDFGSGMYDGYFSNLRTIYKAQLKSSSFGASSQEGR
jgi:hypothetical protein